MCGLVKFFYKRAVVAMLLVICLWLPCQGQNVAGSAELPPLPDVAATTPVGTVVSTQSSPIVTYQNGQLTIDAENSTLAAVLGLVAEKTGAVIDVPAGSGLDRIVEHTGPGRADDVLARLLNGSAFDFIIVGSSERPHDPAQVLLFPHTVDTPAGTHDAVTLASSASAGGQEPKLYGAGFRVDSSTADSTESSESVAMIASQPPQVASGDFIPGAVLDQLQKERLRQRQQVQQQSQTNQQQTNSNNSQ
jgi:hypothetical protein